MESKEKFGTILVTLLAAAHIDIERNTLKYVPVNRIRQILPVDPSLGIGRSVIYLSDGTTVNIEESLQELPAFIWRLN